MAKPVMLSEKAYEILKAQKREGESFSDVVVRRFQKGNAGEILAYYRQRGPNNDLADAVEEASRELRKNFKTRKVDL